MHNYTYTYCTLTYLRCRFFKSFDLQIEMNTDPIIKILYTHCLKVIEKLIDASSSNHLNNRRNLNTDLLIRVLYSCTKC